MYGSEALLDSTGIEISDGALVSHISPNIVMTVVGISILLGNLRENELEHVSNLLHGLLLACICSMYNFGYITFVKRSVCGNCLVTVK